MRDISLIMCYNTNMIIAFFGHADFVTSNDKENKIFDTLIKLISKNSSQQTKIEFYLGGYGNFDKTAKKICLQIKQIYKNSKLCFVTPYQNENYLKKHRDNFDEIILPDTNNVPPKYAIQKRNFWIVRKADFIISYINHPFGNSIKYIKYAQKIKKEYINLGTYNI